MVNIEQLLKQNPVGTDAFLTEGASNLNMEIVTQDPTVAPKRKSTEIKLVMVNPKRLLDLYLPYLSFVFSVLFFVQTILTAVALFWS